MIMAFCELYFALALTKLERMKNKLPVFFFLMYGMISLAWGQERISGQVRDKETNEPLPFASVFIANSIFGAITDNEGKFSIALSAIGQFELVVSYMGYETYRIPINLQRNFQLDCDIRMQPLLLDIQEKVITGKRDRSWYRNQKIFEEYFLGKSKNGKKAKILNPEVLIIDDHSKKGSLLVSAREPILIENSNLGYLIHFVLISNEINLKDKEWVCYGYPFFEELELPARRMARVEKNRKKAFEGSLTHFFQSLYNNTLKDTGYEIFLIKEINHLDDSLSGNFFQGVTDGSELLLERDGLRFLQFNEPLMIHFNQESEETAFHTPLGSNKKMFQTSKLTLRSQVIRINKNGMHFPVNGVFVEGYMAWERIGDMMPVGYSGDLGN